MKFPLPDFGVGKGVEVNFTAPQSDQIQIVLMKDDANYVHDLSPHSISEQEGYH